MIFYSGATVIFPSFSRDSQQSNKYLAYISTEGEMRKSNFFSPPLGDFSHGTAYFCRLAILWMVFLESKKMHFSHNFFWRLMKPSYQLIRWKDGIDFFSSLYSVDKLAKILMPSCHLMMISPPLLMNFEWFRRILLLTSPTFGFLSNKPQGVSQ